MPLNLDFFGVHLSFVTDFAGIRDDAFEPGSTAPVENEYEGDALVCILRYRGVIPNHEINQKKNINTSS